MPTRERTMDKTVGMAKRECESVQVVEDRISRNGLLVTVDTASISILPTVP